jgi:hypothetical protein
MIGAADLLHPNLSKVYVCFIIPHFPIILYPACLSMRQKAISSGDRNFKVPANTVTAFVATDKVLQPTFAIRISRAGRSGETRQAY